MPSRQPFAVYETTASNSGKITKDGLHGVSGECTRDQGGVDDGENSGMWCEVLKMPDVPEKYGSVDEFPSQSAGLDPTRSSR